MRKTFTLFVWLLPILAIGQVPWPSVDTTTPSTNTVTYSGYMTVPGVYTNVPGVTINTNTYFGDDFPTAFGKVNFALNYIWQFLMTNNFGGGGGSGFGYNPIVTNTITLLNTNSVTYYPQSLILTNMSSLSGCSGGTNFTLDTNQNDTTWGTLTNVCGDVLIVSSLTTNGWVNSGTGEAFTHWSLGLVTNVGWWKTNQWLLNETVTFYGAGRTNDNGTYTNPAAWQIGEIFDSSYNPNSTWWFYGNPVYSSGQDMAFGQYGKFKLFGTYGEFNYYPGPPWYAYEDYNTYGSIAFQAMKVPGVPFPMFNSGGYAPNPAPSFSFSYSLTNGPTLRAIGTELGNSFNGFIASTNVTTNIVYSASFDWVLLEPNANGSYSVISFDQNGSFNWMQPGCVATVCPAVPNFESPPILGLTPTCFSVESGAQWSTVAQQWTNNSYAYVTNEDCVCCPPIATNLDIPPPLQERISFGVFLTNYASVTLSSSVNGGFYENGLPVASGAQLGLLWNYASTSIPQIILSIASLATQASTNFTTVSNFSYQSTLFVTNLSASLTVSNLVVSNAAWSVLNGYYTNTPGSSVLNITNGMLTLLEFSNYINSSNSAGKFNLYSSSYYQLASNSTIFSTTAAANMIAPGWGTNWAYLRTTDAPPVVTPLVVGTYSPTNLNAYWAYGYNWLARIGAGTNLQLQLAGDWQQSSSSFSEEAPHYIWIVNDGPYSESLSFSPSSNWVFMPTFSVPISPFSLATNQILKLTIDHLTPGFQNTPFTVTGVTVTNPAALLY